MDGEMWDCVEVTYPFRLVEKSFYLFIFEHAFCSLKKSVALRRHTTKRFAWKDKSKKRRIESDPVKKDAFRGKP